MARQMLEILGRAGSLDDFERPAADSPERVSEFVTGIAVISEDMTEPWKWRFGSMRGASVAILDIGLTDEACD